MFYLGAAKVINNHQKKVPTSPLCWQWNSRNVRNSRLDFKVIFNHSWQLWMSISKTKKLQMTSFLSGETWAFWNCDAIRHVRMDNLHATISPLSNRIPQIALVVDSQLIILEMALVWLQRLHAKGVTRWVILKKCVARKWISEEFSHLNVMNFILIYLMIRYILGKFWELI